jgi:hypothetical protein
VRRQSSTMGRTVGARLTICQRGFVDDEVGRVGGRLSGVQVWSRSPLSMVMMSGYSALCLERSGVSRNDRIGGGGDGGVRQGTPPSVCYWRTDLPRVRCDRALRAPVDRRADERRHRRRSCERKAARAPTAGHRSYCRSSEAGDGRTVTNPSSPTGWAWALDGLLRTQPCLPSTSPVMIDL